MTINRHPQAFTSNTPSTHGPMGRAIHILQRENFTTPSVRTVSCNSPTRSWNC